MDKKSIPDFCVWHPKFFYQSQVGETLSLNNKVIMDVLPSSAPRGAPD
jgi:hypothetical protein